MDAVESDNQTEDSSGYSDDEVVQEQISLALMDDVLEPQTRHRPLEMRVMIQVYCPSQQIQSAVGLAMFGHETIVRTYQRKFTNSRNGTNHLPYLSYSNENLQIAIKAKLQMNH
ncbi:unnamed protein product [Parnassius apollo]|uniref:(apollo) hypothetical protein n=1 Tax=Parnassius apollo TaxID=110799 RepID=A0A8S3WMB5_PARAO|nr:unnamed protein product [Parnassius apollo]